MKTIYIRSYLFKPIYGKFKGKQEEIAQKLERPVDTIRSWRNGETDPVLDIEDFEIFASLARKPLISSFLPSFPDDEWEIKDFRKKSDPDAPFSKKTLYMLQKARRTISIWKELLDRVKESAEVSLPVYQLTDRPEAIATKERKRLKLIYTYSYPFDWSHPSEIYNFWNQVFSRENILVLQVALHPEEARGFSIIEDGYAAIAVNGRVPVDERIFTVVHEYAHLLLREQAVCNNESESVDDAYIASVEQWCNRFASDLLVPHFGLKNEKRIQYLLEQKEYEKAVKKISTRFKVTPDIVLNRLLELHIINGKEFQRLKRDMESSEEKNPAKL